MRLARALEESGDSEYSTITQYQNTKKIRRWK